MRELTVSTDSRTSITPVLVCTTSSIELAVPLSVADTVINTSLECTTTMCYRSCGGIARIAVSIDRLVRKVAGSICRSEQ